MTDVIEDFTRLNNEDEWKRWLAEPGKERFVLGSSPPREYPVLASMCTETRWHEPYERAIYVYPLRHSFIDGARVDEET